MSGLAEVLFAVAAIGSPTAAIVATVFAYKSKQAAQEGVRQTKSVDKQIQTGNGHSLGDAVRNIEENLLEVSSRVYKNAEQIARARSEAQRHLYIYKHERQLDEE